MTTTRPMTRNQLAVIEALRAGERTGGEIREFLRDGGIYNISLANFYMMLKRMEDAGLIKSRYGLIRTWRSPIKEHHYRLPGKGFKTLARRELER